MSTQDFVTKAIAKHGDKWDYSETEYFGNNKPVAIRCRIHGIFTPLANDHLSKKAGCPKCAGVKRLTKDEFVAKSIAAHTEQFDYSKVIYRNVETKVKIICPKGHEFEQTPHDHMEGFGCVYCVGKAKITEKQFLEQSKECHGDKYDYSLVNYVDNKTPVEIICKRHQKSFWQKPQNHRTGNGCPICGHVVIPDKSEFVEKAIKRRGDRYDYTHTVYIKKDVPLRIDCRVHGEFWQFPYNHLKGHNCPKCACSDVSKPESKLLEIFAEFSPVSDRSVLNGRELDLLFEKHKVAVEINGIYWHSDEHCDKKSHVSKTEQCSEKGIKLFHFTDHQINLKLPIVTSMIRSALKVSDRLNARDCEIRKVSFNEYKQFFDANHISGNTTAKIAYGLYKDDVLVSCMSFSKPRFDTSAEWEIIRLASILNTSVRGAASKLFSAFVKEINPKSVISYADRRYGSGEVYKQLGFIFERNTDVGYAYHHKINNPVSRYQAQKHKLSKLLGDRFNPELSERDNMIKAGWHLMYDCGNSLWRWK